MGRIYRQGQTKPCVIYRLLTTGTVEEVIYQRQLQKSGLVHQTVDASANIGKRNWNKAKNVTKEELVDCFTLNESSACCTKERFGIHWPDYDISRLSQLGCTDVSLLTVAPCAGKVLSFVHVAASGVDESGTDSDEEFEAEQLDESSIGFNSDIDETEFAM
jgi:DNA repair and recombination protein RAD54 and RAD54-like protein